FSSFLSGRMSDVDMEGRTAHRTDLKRGKTDVPPIDELTSLRDFGSSCRAGGAAGPTVDRFRSVGSGEIRERRRTGDEAVDARRPRQSKLPRTGELTGGTHESSSCVAPAMDDSVGVAGLMADWLMRVIKAEATQLIALAADDDELRTELRALAREILAATEEH